MKDATVRAFPVILFALLLLGALLRFHDLEADPPRGLSWSQGLHTDGAVVVQNARNQVLWGSPILDYGIDMYWFPLSYVVNLLSFSAMGVSTAAARTGSVLLGLGSILGIALGLRATGATRKGLVAALFLTISFPYLMYNRLPLAEPAMIFLLGLAFLFFCLGASGGESRWLAVSGFFAVAAPLFGKAHSVYIPVVGLAALLLGPPEDRTPRRLLWYIGGGVGAAVLWGAVLLAPHGREIVDHYLHESVVKHAKGAGQRSFFSEAGEKIITMGQTKGVGFLARDYLMLLAAFAALPLLLARRLKGAVIESAAARYAALWLLVGWTFLACVKWVAPRYLVALFPPMAVLAAILILPGRSPSTTGENEGRRKKRERKRAQSGRPAPVGVAVLFLVSFLSSLVIIANFGALGRVFPFLAPLASVVPSALAEGYPWTLLLPGAILAALITFLSVTRPPPAGLPSGAAAIIVLVAVVGLGTYQYVRWAGSASHSVLTAGRQIGEVLGDEAHLLGAYGPALTLDNGLRASPYFGPEYMGPDHNPNLFEDYGITHVVLAASGDFQTMLDRYPDVAESLVPVGEFRFDSMWSSSFVLFRIPAVLNGVRIHDYTPTEAEERLAKDLARRMEAKGS